MGPIERVCARLSPRFFVYFPRLSQENTNWAPTSRDDSKYNCIAWAAGDERQWWEPSGGGGTYWPPTAPLEPTVGAYQAAFEAQGYVVCPTGDLEQRFEKVAIFAIRGTEPTHAARQLRDGQWTSKLGEGIDISHVLPGDVGGGIYGEVVCFLMRPLDPSSQKWLSVRGFVVEVLASAVWSVKRAVSTLRTRFSSFLQYE